MRYNMQAKGRMNIMLFARLKEVSSGKVVCVGTYHMPCMFWLPSVMVMHTALVSQRMKALAGNDPHVLAGGACVSRQRNVAYCLLYPTASLTACCIPPQVFYSLPIFFFWFRDSCPPRAIDVYTIDGPGPHICRLSHT
jgi:hypothetical protein